MSLRKVNPGDPVSAAQWNELIGRIETGALDLMLNEHSFADGRQAAQVATSFRELPLVQFRTGAFAMEQYEVATCAGDVIIVNDRPMYLLDVVFDDPRFVILNAGGDVGSSSDGWGYLLSPHVAFPVKVEAIPSTVGDSLGLEPGQTTLHEERIGFTYIGDVDTTNKIVWALLDNTQRLAGLAVANSNISSETAGTCTLLSGGDGSEVPDTGRELEIFNPNKTKIWAGSFIYFRENRKRDHPASFISIWNNSATMIRALAAEAMTSSGTLYNIDNITPLNGYYSPSSAQARFRLTNYDIDDNVTVWCVLAGDEWEILSGDCNP